MQHFPFCCHFQFCLSSAYTVQVYIWRKMSSDESSDSEMPYDSSDEEVWEEEKVSGDDDSDGGPGFLDQLDGTSSLGCKLSLPFPI